MQKPGRNLRDEKKIFAESKNVFFWERLDRDSSKIFSRRAFGKKNTTLPVKFFYYHGGKNSLLMVVKIFYHPSKIFLPATPRKPA